MGSLSAALRPWRHKDGQIENESSPLQPQYLLCVVKQSTASHWSFHKAGFKPITAVHQQYNGVDGFSQTVKVAIKRVSSGSPTH